MSKTNINLKQKEEKNSSIGNKIKKIMKNILENFRWFFNSLRYYILFVFEQIKNNMKNFYKKLKCFFKKVKKKINSK
jgi:ABC-type proline/glycine betaine transport system permease subunit